MGKVETTNPPPNGVDPKFFSSLPTEEQAAVRDTMKIVSQEECIGPNTEFCRTMDEYYKAWQSLAKTSPTAGLKLLANRDEKKPWPIAPGLLRPQPEKTLAGVPDELWKKALAFRWVLKTMEQGEQRKLFIEKTLSGDLDYGLVLLTVARNIIGEESFLNKIGDKLRTDKAKDNPEWTAEILRGFFAETFRDEAGAIKPAL